MNRLFGILLACFIASPAWAGSSTVNYNSTGSAPFRTTTDGSSNNLSQQTIWDYSAGANGAGVDTSHGLLTDPASAPAWGIGATGSAVPANATYMGMIVGGNLTGIPGTAYGASVDENTSSQLHTDLAAPPNQAYSATWGALSYSSGNNPAGGDAKGAWWQDMGAWAGTALGAPSNYGTSPGAVEVPGVNAFITNAPVLGAGSAIIGKFGIDQTTPGTTNGVQVNAALPAGTNLLGKTGIDQTTPGTTNGVSIVGVNGATALGGSGAVGAGAQRVAVGTDPATVAGTAPVKTSVPIINGANTYNTIAASQSAQALTGGSGGATGDYLSHCTVIPTTVSPGVVTILDNSTTIYGFPGGSSSLSNLVPFSIPIGALSTSGAWKITTGAGLSVVCVGKFT